MVCTLKVESLVPSVAMQEEVEPFRGGIYLEIIRSLEALPSKEINSSFVELVLTRVASKLRLGSPCIQLFPFPHLCHTVNVK
jgi:hypothetical protein